MVGMLIEIEVNESDNCPLSMTRMFSTLGEQRPATRLWTTGPDGAEGIYEVVGWSVNGPVPAYAVLVEDSGEGMAMLVYGAEEGIRLKPQGSEDSWSLDSSSQWGEALLLLDKDAQIE